MVKCVRKSCSRLWVAGVLACGVLAGGCTSPVVPPAHMPRETRRALPDATLLESLRLDWSALRNTNLPVAERNDTINRYNKNLLILLKRYRVDILDHGHGWGGVYPCDVELVYETPLRDVYDDIVPACEIRFDLLKEHYTVPGVGVPMVGIIPASKADQVKDIHHIHMRGVVRNLTAVLEFPPRGKPRLRIIPRNRQEYVRIGRLDYQLAGDVSAPIEMYWDLTQIDKSCVLGLFRPQQLRDVTGLFCLDGYDPDKIPVICTHGLLSSAGTFDNMVNRLLSDPVIRRHYQFWYFNYPTGVSWTVSAEAYRRSLQQLRDQVDPRHRNRNWDDMVVIGHSMGGLITHYSQCTEPWLLLEKAPQAGSLSPYLDARYVDEPLPGKKLDGLRKDFFFRPVQAGMVVYMATPHQGAPIARYRLAMFLSRLVQLPTDLVDEAVRIATLRQDNIVLHPQKLTEWFTSIGQLSPESYSIRGLKGLRVRDVPTYSVIGNRDCAPVEKSSDGVVPYWSSHIPRGGQKVVMWGHSVQDSPDTALYLNSILKEHLRRIRK